VQIEYAQMIEVVESKGEVGKMIRGKIEFDKGRALINGCQFSRADIGASQNE